jgi:hypothetical protein
MGGANGGFKKVVDKEGAVPIATFLQTPHFTSTVPAFQEFVTALRSCLHVSEVKVKSLPTYTNVIQEIPTTPLNSK